MIKKLRRRFILISALSVFFVLAVTIGAINISNRVVIEGNAQTTLQEIVKEGPQRELEPGRKPGEGPEDLRQEHYFVASIDNSGNIIDLDNRQMFILSEAECRELALKVYQGELSGGRCDNFRYIKSSKNDGATLVAFLDLKERLDSHYNFVLLSSTISFGAYLAFIALIVLGSRIAFKPSEEAYKKQKRFITNASHELKTPLTVISADLDIIEMDNGKSEWSESIRDQVTRLTEMANQLVILSRLEEEDPNKYPFEDFSINEMAKGIASSFEASFKKAGIKFSYNFASDLHLYGNKRLIDELIHIYLDNSLKYTGGESKSSYFVISKNDKGKVEFKFSNTINKNDEVDTKQMMERFYRSPSNKMEGSGVGLSIAQEIINLHKAKINIDKTNSVLTFIITF